MNCPHPSKICARRLERTTESFVSSVSLLELKCIQEVLPIHPAQLLRYMELLDIPLGLVINLHELTPMPTVKAHWWGEYWQKSGSGASGFHYHLATGA